MSKYLQSDLTNAIHAVKTRELTVKTAATQFSVPASTIRFKIKSGSDEIKKRGKHPVLSRSDEKDIYEWMVTCAGRGNSENCIVEFILKLNLDPSFI